MTNTDKVKKIKEDGYKRFKRVAIKRTKAVLEKIRVLGHCANRNVYKYSDSDVNKIFGAIEEQLKIIKPKFKSPKRDFRL